MIYFLDCTDTFNPVANTRSFGGTGKNVTTVDACKTECVALDSCLGFDFDATVDVKCWLITKQTMIDGSVTSTVITQYRRQECTGWLRIDSE